MTVLTRRDTPNNRFDEQYIPEPNSGCWLWIGTCGAYRYGAIRVSGKTIRAHRFSYERFVGPVPNGLFVLHRCDVSCCVNPTHLFLGTQLDNMRDAQQKGRLWSPRGEESWARRNPGRLSRGEQHGGAKLTNTSVIEIRCSALKRSELARKYGVTWRVIDLIQKRLAWAAVP